MARRKKKWAVVFDKMIHGPRDNVIIINRLTNLESGNVYYDWSIYHGEPKRDEKCHWYPDSYCSYGVLEKTEEDAERVAVEVMNDRIEEEKKELA